MRMRRLKRPVRGIPDPNRYPGFLGVGAVFVAVFMMVSMVSVTRGGDVYYPDQTLSGGYQTGHFDDVWDLTEGEITISFTYDGNGMVDDFGGAAHAWAELGVRSQSWGVDFNPYGSGNVYVYSMKSYDLFAGQNILIGEVTVERVDDTLYVTYLIDEADWYLTETHLAVTTDLALIPQKLGNPIPGKFPYATYHDPPVDEFQYVVDVSGCGDSATFYVAAHAAVIHAPLVCLEVASDATVQWSGDGLAWCPAVTCWTHSSWPTIDGATWIWRTVVTDPQEEYANVPDGGWWFDKDLTIPTGAFDITGSIAVDADNSEAVYVNGDFIMQDGSLDKNGPDLREWSTIRTEDISGSLVPGPNSIIIRALNYFDETHCPDNGYDYGDGYLNPAGLVFKAAVCYRAADQMESAWGYEYPFPGKNWATYMTYEPDPVLVEGSGVWLATDYDWTAYTFEPDPVGAETLDLDDKLILQRMGGQGEGAYDLPSKPTAPWNNHRIWWDRDGVDPYQNSETANTGGVYNVVITLRATSVTTGTAHMTINGLAQGFETDGDWDTIELTPAGMTWTGDMQHLVVFFGVYGYGATHSAVFSNILVSQA